MKSNSPEGIAVMKLLCMVLKRGGEMAMGRRRRGPANKQWGMAEDGVALGQLDDWVRFQSGVQGWVERNVVQSQTGSAACVQMIELRGVVEQPGRNRREGVAVHVPAGRWGGNGAMAAAARTGMLLVSSASSHSSGRCAQRRLERKFARSHWLGNTVDVAAVALGARIHLLPAPSTRERVSSGGFYA